MPYTRHIAGGICTALLAIAPAIPGAVLSGEETKLLVYYLPPGTHPEFERTRERFLRLRALPKHVIVEPKHAGVRMQPGVLRQRWPGDPFETCLRTLGSVQSRRFTTCIQHEREGRSYTPGPYGSN